MHVSIPRLPWSDQHAYWRLCLDEIGALVMHGDYKNFGDLSLDEQRSFVPEDLGGSALGLHVAVHAAYKAPSNTFSYNTP